MPEDTQTQEQAQDSKPDKSLEKHIKAESQFLVKMKKGDETLDVHFTTVAAHVAAGWSEI